MKSVSMIPFDRDDILELSTQSSFEKGEDNYNEGCVRKITKTGNVFEGKVSGTSSYTVRLDISDDELQFHCSCPYDHGGICKHSVAFALAVIDGKYDEKSDTSAVVENLSHEEFKECYQNADTQKKLNFFKQLLDKDVYLQNQFIVFAGNKSEDLDSLVAVDIDVIKASVFDDLISIDFDTIVESYDSYNNNYYDDEGYADEAREEIGNAISPYTTKAIELFKKGNLLEGTSVMLGMYEGVQNLPDLDSSEYDLFYNGYEEEVKVQLTSEFKTIIESVEQTVKSEEVIFGVFDLVMQRFTLYKAQELDDDLGIHYDMKVFEKLLITLIINKKTAEYLLELLRKNDLECLSMAYVLMRIATVAENEPLWLDTASCFSEFDPEITTQLLEKYKATDVSDKFNQTALQAFKKWPDKFSLFLIENLDKEQEKELYVKALQHYTKTTHSLKHYKILREYLSGEERTAFVNSTMIGYNDLFYIQLLELEGRYSDILSYAKKKQDMYYDYEKVLAPITNIYPEECFEIIRDKCNSSLRSTDKNRKTYHRMTKWLSVMTQINSKQIQTKEYIGSLFNHKPNLPALKDELRSGLDKKYIP